MIHQFIVSGRHFHSIHQRSDAVSADLPDIRHPRPVNLFSVCLFQTFTDRMRRRTLRKRRIFQKLLIFYLIVMNTIHFKYALRQCTCFVKDNRPGFRQCFQIVRSLHQNSRIACSTNSRKKTKRNTDDKRTRTTNDKEGQRPVNPGFPSCWKSKYNHTHKRWQKRQCQCRITDGRCINPRKF